ncbi:ricin-type beta-trefoil lectin domain protein [Streptomyces sp. BBFR51]|uniref:ricin-type beta-trefoil lectin domain protein n=1 Tax=Streptomyces sp. BBFR51 TaxID=3372856 RepID=UPI0037DD975C
MPSPRAPRPDGGLPKRVPGSGKQVGSSSAPAQDKVTAEETGPTAPAGGPEAADRDLPRLVQFSSLGSRTNSGESRTVSSPAAGTPADDSSKNPSRGLFRRRGDKARREGFRGALGVVGVVGLLAAGAVVLTLALGGEDGDGKRDGRSVAVDSGGYDLDDVAGLGRPADPSASVSAPTGAGDGKDAKPSAKPSTSASPSGHALGTASAAPGGEATAPAQDNAPSEPSEPKSMPGVGVFSHASQRCIDIVGGKAAQGARLMIWDCSGSASQHWTFPSDGTMRALGMCVELAGGSTDDGADLRMASCDGRQAQRFTLNARHDLVSGLANKCADVRDEQTSNGTRLQLWNCNGHDNQKWSTS